MTDIKRPVIIRGIDDASWTGSVYDSTTSIGHFSLTCFENSCVGHINLWTTGEEYIIKPVIQNGTVSLMKVVFIKNLCTGTASKNLIQYTR